MTQNPLTPAEEITCENITDEIVASYAKQGFTLVFAEEIMRYDLTQVLPDREAFPIVSYLAWNDQNVDAFFNAYEAAFCERPGFPGWSKEKWLGWTADDPLFRPDLSFLMQAQDQVAGFITTAADEAAPERVGYIIQLGVAPRWRSQGLGAALMRHTLQVWQADGKEAIILHVNVNNPGAIHLFQQSGFVTAGRRGKFRRQVV